MEFLSVALAEGSSVSRVSRTFLHKVFDFSALHTSLERRLLALVSDSQSLARRSKRNSAGCDRTWDCGDDRVGQGGSLAYRSVW
jgi:hypothetical protein